MKFFKIIALTAGLMYCISNNAWAEDKKPTTSLISGNLTAEAVTKQLLLSGKLLSEFQMTHFAGNLNIGPVTAFSGAYRSWHKQSGSIS
jgi:hypothetical protein